MQIKGGVDIGRRIWYIGRMTTIKKKQFTVGLWLDLKTPAGKPQGLQIWDIQSGKTDGEGMRWFITVEADNEEEALKLGQSIYSGKKVQAKAEAA